MKSYEVTFYRHLVNSAGDPFKSNLTTVHVDNCASRREASESAIRRFEDAWAVNRWRNVAHEFEVRENRSGPLPHKGTRADKEAA